MTLNPLFPDHALPRRRKGDLPKRLYKKLAPSNPYVKVPFFRAMELMYKRKLAETIREDEEVKIRANSTWLAAFEMLEKRGLHLGVHVNELAAARGITPKAAKAAMLKAEEMIYRHFGLNVSFVDNNGMWRLATEAEVAQKYADALKAMSTYAKRIAMYRPMAEELGTATGTLVVPLFELKESNDPIAN